MRKWSRSFLNSLCFLFFSLHAAGQKEKFDITSYTAPTEWKKETTNGAVSYMTVNKDSGTFCVIAIYAGKSSTGDPQKDFTNEWNDLVATPFKAITNPETQTETNEEGWKVVMGAAPVKIDSTDLFIVLTVFSGFGKTVSVRSSLNDQTYLSQLDEFFATFSFDKTKTVTTRENNTVSITNNTGKFGSMLYTTPAGWNEQVFQDGVVFKPLDLPAGEHLSMQVMQPLNFSGNLEQALSQSFDEAAAMYNGSKMNYAGTGSPYQKTEIKRSFNGWEYIKGSGGIRIGNPEFGLDLFVIKINNRIERVAILKSRKNCGMSTYYTDDRQIYNYAIAEFLLSLQFTDGPSPLILPGTLSGNSIAGVWQGISLSTSASSGIRYDVYCPVFYSNGLAFFGPHFPVAGLDGSDERVYAELQRRDWGTYEFSNGKGILKMPYGDFPIRMENNKIIIAPNNTDHHFFQLNSVDGARFNGTYTLGEVNGKIPSISFMPDGRFIDNGAVKVLYHEYVDCINPAFNPGSGNYEVKNYTIHFNYSDGRKIKIAFLGAGYNKGNPSPATLRMSANEDELHRQ